VFKSSRISWAGHVAHVGERRVIYWYWWVNLRERDHVENPIVDGLIILKWIVKKWKCRRGLD
jgi:hypothetical protein